MKRTAPAQKSTSLAVRNGQAQSVRDKILATASDLFYREGIRAVGIDTVIAESKVAKQSLYKWFPSKEALVATFLAEQNRRYWERWDKNAARFADNPEQQLRAQLKAIAERIDKPWYRGCPFLNAATEFPDENYPGRVSCRANKEELHQRLKTLAASMNARRPQDLADQLFLLIEGAFANSQILRAQIPTRQLLKAADALIAAHTDD